MLKSIPIANGITLANLACGLLAIPLALNPDTSRYAFYLVLLAAVLDFFDGFVARLLGQEGPLGQQLDSLADLVSFGVVPGLIWKSWMSVLASRRLIPPSVRPTLRIHYCWYKKKTKPNWSPSGNISSPKISVGKTT